eukprot:8137251-Prorocentrum_lima.AAC.1
MTSSLVGSEMCIRDSFFKRAGSSHSGIRVDIHTFAHQGVVNVIRVDQIEHRVKARQMIRNALI